MRAATVGFLPGEEDRVVPQPDQLQVRRDDDAQRLDPVRPRVAEDLHHPRGRDVWRNWIPVEVH